MVVVVTVLLGACSSPDDPGTAERVGRSDVAPQATARPTDLGPLPFDELLGLGLDPAAMADRWAAWSAGYPEAMTRCMRQRGYNDFVEPAEPAPTFDELEDASRMGTASAGLRDHGYGITVNARLQIDNATTDRSADTSDDGEGPPPWLTAMSPGARQAYGTDHRSCQSAASREFPHPNGGSAAGAAATAAFVELSELRRSFADAPEVGAIWDEWAGCMRGHGWSALRRTDLVEALNGAVDPVLLRLDEARRAAPGALPLDAPVVVDAHRTVEELQALEHEMVADDLACAAPMELDRREHDALHRLQSAYLAHHGDEVRRLVTASGLTR